MKIEPIVFNQLNTTHTSFEIVFQLETNITFISGDSGVGKSAVFSFIKELAAEDKRIRCFNYLDQKSNYKKSIKQSKGKLFVIDNADILLDDSMRKYIAQDSNNQYIIIGRNPTGLLLSMDEIYDLHSEKKNGKTLFTLKKSL